MCARKVLIVLLVLLIQPSGTNAQDVRDSLLQVLKAATVDSVKVSINNELARILQVSDPQASLKYGQSALVLAKASGNIGGEALALKRIGFFYYNRSVFDSAQLLWQESLEAYRRKQDADGVSNMLNNLGSIAYNVGNNSKALGYFMEALNEGEKSGNMLRMITSTNNIGLVYMSKPTNYDQALIYLNKSLALATQINDKDNIGSAHANIGEIQMNNGKYALAEYHFRQAIKASEPDGTILPYVLLDMGKLYQKKKLYPFALQWFDSSFHVADRLKNRFYQSEAAYGKGETYRMMGNGTLAIQHFEKSRELAGEVKALERLSMAYKGLAETYGDMQNYKLAYLNEKTASRLSDSLSNFNSDSLRRKLELGLKQREIALLQADTKLKEQAIKKAKLIRNAVIAGLALVITMIVILFRDYKNKIRINKLLDQRKAEIEALLLNILPFEVATELQQTGKSLPRYYESTTVMFTDFVGFSRIAETLTPQEVTAELNEFFTEMDEIIDRHGLEKIKTIGDSYMCAGGIPSANNTHPVDAVRAGLEIVEYLRKKNKAREEAGQERWDIRIGLNTGSLVAGVVGKKKYAYDIWGSAVNIASRMESNGQPGMLNISASTYELIKDQFECEYRGKIYAKNVGEIDMYFVKRELVNGELKKESREQKAESS